MTVRYAILFGAASLLVCSAAPAAIDNKKADELMKKGLCSACHSLDRKGVGPAYKEVAAKRKKEKNAAATLAKKVRDGGGGVYGQVPMPPNPKDKVSDDEIKLLVEWILGR
jgi:cytochrome c